MPAAAGQRPRYTLPIRRVVKVSDFIRVFGFMFFLALTRTDFTLQTLILGFYATRRGAGPTALSGLNYTSLGSRPPPHARAQIIEKRPGTEARNRLSNETLSASLCLQFFCFFFKPTKEMIEKCRNLTFYCN